MKSGTLSLLCTLALVSCGTRPSAENSTGDSTQVVSAPREFHFRDNDFLINPLALDLTDTAAVAALSPTYRSTGVDREDGSPWYCRYEFDGPLSISWDYYPRGESRRIWLREISTGDSTVSFTNGIQVGMSRAGFMNAFHLNDAAAEAADVIKATYEGTSDGELHTGTFTFSNDKLSWVRLQFQYSSPPRSMDEFEWAWTSVKETDKTLYRHCVPYTFELEEIPVIRNGESLTMTILKLGLVQDSRVDTVEWIRRTSKGLSIRTRTPQNQTFNVAVNFLNADWTLATWNDEMFMVSGDASALPTIDCAGGGESEDDPD